MNAEQLGRIFSTEILPAAIGLVIGYRIWKKIKEEKRIETDLRKVNKE